MQRPDLEGGLVCGQELERSVEVGSPTEVQSTAQERSVQQDPHGPFGLGGLVDQFERGGGVLDSPRRLPSRYGRDDSAFQQFESLRIVDRPELERALQVPELFPVGEHRARLVGSRQGGRVRLLGAPCLIPVLGQLGRRAALPRELWPL